MRADGEEVCRGHMCLSHEQLELEPDVSKRGVSPCLTVKASVARADALTGGAGQGPLGTTSRGL